jgi:hypothetical protein
MGLSYIDRILYDSGGHTGNTYYVRFVRLVDGLIWDAVNEEMAATPNWSDSAITLVEADSAGQFPIVVPAALPRGNFDVIVYQQLGSVPQNTDDVTLQYDTSIGSIFRF